MICQYKYCRIMNMTILTVGDIAHEHRLGLLLGHVDGVSDVMWVFG